MVAGMVTISGICAALPQFDGQGSTRPPVRRVVLNVDQGVVEVDDATKTVYATGGARLEYQDIVVTANAIEANYETRAVSAQGEVVLQQGNRRLSGSDLTFDLDRGTGYLHDIHAEIDRVFYTGTSVQVSPVEWVINGSTITTCDRARPHYKITARQVVIKPGESASFRRAAIWLGRRRLFTWPRYRMSLRKGEAERPILLPQLGVGPRDGLYLSLTPRLSPPTSRLQSRLEARLTTNRGVRGRVTTSYPLPWGDVYALASQREDRQEIGDTFGPEEDILADLSVDRIPDVGIRVLPQSIDSGLTVTGQVSAARVKEFPTNVDSKRLAVGAVLRLRRYRISPVLAISETVGARHARYDHGLDQTMVSLATTLHYRRSPRFGLDLGYLRRTATGDTPFEFDRIQIARELRGGVDWVISPVWQVTLDGRFDLGRERFRDADITVSKTAHCLVYSVKWRQIRREFSVAVGLSQLPGE